MMRGRRRGLVGTMARTAVIAGTATAVSNSVSSRQYNKAASQENAQIAAAQEQQAMVDMQAQLDAMQTQQAAAAMPPPAAAPASVATGGSDLMAQLQQLATMKEQGLLSDEEFAQAKQRLLTA